MHSNLIATSSPDVIFVPENKHTKQKIQHTNGFYSNNLQLIKFGNHSFIEMYAAAIMIIFLSQHSINVTQCYTMKQLCFE